MAKIYTENEVREATSGYFGEDELATNVWVTKYALRNIQGDFVEKTPTDMHRRLAKEFGRVESEFGGDRKISEEEVFECLDQFRYIVPQGSPMYGIGNDYQKVSLSNCVVVDAPADSMSSILNRGRDLANLFKRRCGVGLDISTLRPEDMVVRNAAGTTTGAWSFADLYSYICRMVGQNGRRGALMISMDVRHPDIFQFVRMKRDLEKVTGANVSVRITDEFMHAVEADGFHKLKWPLEGEPVVTETIRAKDLWDEIISSATATAEPGILMWDNITSMLPAHCYPDFKTVSTNPCGEVPLSAGDSCRLISINLKSFVDNPFEDDASFNYEKFSKYASIAMRLADDLVTLEEEKLKEIKGLCDTEDERELWDKLLEACVNGRRTGIGTHGLADALACLKLKYDSEESLLEIDRIYKTLRDSTYRESVELAKERGAFPAFDWELEKDNAFIQSLPQDLLEEMSVYGRRNISILTNAPTGSVSICSQTSSGIEPVFRNFYIRRRKLSHNEKGVEPDFVDDVGDKWVEYKVYHHNLEEYLRVRGGEDIPEFFVQSDNIDWTKRVDVQSTIQKYIDHSISSTINLPKGTEESLVSELYLRAWKKGLKGVTIYVDGSRSGVLIDDEGEGGGSKQLIHLLKEVEAINEEKVLDNGVIASLVKLPKKFINGPTKIVKREGNKYYIHFSYLENDEHENHPIALWIITNHFARGEFVALRRAINALYDLMKEKGIEGKLVDEHIGKVGGDDWAAKLGKAISMCLRHNIPITQIVHAIEDIEGDYIATTLTAVRKFLKEAIEDGTLANKVCDECGSDSVVYESGCDLCLDCGFSGCN